MKDNTLRTEMMEILEEKKHPGYIFKYALSLDDAVDQLLSAIKNRLPKESHWTYAEKQQFSTNPAESMAYEFGRNQVIKEVKQALGVDKEGNRSK